MAGCTCGAAFHRRLWDHRRRRGRRRDSWLPGNGQYENLGEIRNTHRPLRLENTLEEGRAHAEYGAMSMDLDTMMFDDDIRIFRLVEDDAGKN